MRSLGNFQLSFYLLYKAFEKIFRSKVQLSLPGRTEVCHFAETQNNNDKADSKQ